MIEISLETIKSTLASIEHLGGIKNSQKFLEEFWLRAFSENEALCKMLFANCSADIDSKEDAFLFGSFLVYLSIQREIEGRELDEMFS